MDRNIERQRLLGSSDSEDGFSLYTKRFKTIKTKPFEVEFKEVIKVVKRGNLDEIRNLLKKRNLQLTDLDGLTVLHVAAAANNTDVLNVLLENKRCAALLNRQDKRGVTPLIAAAMVGSHATLELLCARGADPCKTIYKTGKNVLHLAATQSDSQAAAIVLKYNSSPELINALNDNGDTPLIEAVYIKALEMIDLLFGVGADITIQNPENGRTFLHVVIAYNRLSLLENVLKHPQATVQFAEIKDMKDDTALFIAVKLDKLEMVTLLLNTFKNLTGINETDRKTVFHIAIRHDKVDILRALLNSCCKSCIDYMDGEFRTPLMFAAELDRASCLQELILNGADYNLTNPQTGETFVHVIARNMSKSTLPFVMNITDISWFFTEVDFRGNTPYMTAITNGNSHFLRYALKIKQIDLRDENSEGEPPVYFTAKHGHLKTMMTLLMSPRYYYFMNRRESFEGLSDAEEVMKLELRGDIYATDVYILLGKKVKHPLVSWFPNALLKKTPENRNVFHACALGGNLEGLTFLYEFFSLFAPKHLGDLFDKADVLGNTPLLFAAQCGVSSISCVHFFITHGADMALMNKSGLNIFNAILMYNPEVSDSLLISLLDSCVSGKKEHYYDDRMNINVNFSMFCPKSENVNQMTVIYMLFAEMTRHDSTKLRRQVLQHPVVELFLMSKFQIQKKCLLLRFIILLFVTIMVSFLFPVIYLGDRAENKFSFLTPFVQKCFSLQVFAAAILPVFMRLPNFLYGSFWPTDAVSLVPLIVITPLICFGRTIFIAPELTAMMILSCWIYVMVFLTTLYNPYSLQLSVFLQILHSISKHFLVLSMVMFAFALSFFCIYRDDPKFSSLPTSVIYTFVVLLLGYFPDMPTFDFEYFTTTPITARFIIECSLMAAFTLIIVLGSINMLVGLAVRSANVAEHEGKVYQNHHQAHILFMSEYWFNNRVFWWFVKKGIWAEKLEKIREKQRIKLNIGLYDEKIKDIVGDSCIRKLRSIIFQQCRSAKLVEAEAHRGSKNFEDTLYSWVQTKVNIPSPNSLILRQAKWDAKNSSQ